MSYGSDYIAEAKANDAETRNRIEAHAKEGIWVTADGRKLNVQQMTERHIRNCIAYIKRVDKTDYMYAYICMFEKELNKRGLAV